MKELVIGMNQGLRHHVHRTWAETFKCTPALFFKPKTVADVQDIVREAVKSKISVTTYGSSHSPSKLTITSGWLVNLDNLNNILDYQEHKGYTDVYVEAGARLKDLNVALERRGLALQNLGSISEQSVAGVISTGTHGASYCHGLISEQIVSLEIVTETGEIVTASDNENKELFSAALLGLGAIGVIVRATIRAVPAFNIESRACVLDFDDLLDPKIWNSVFLQSEYHRIWWYPYTDKVYVWTGEKTTKAAQPPAYSFYGTRLGRFLYELLLFASVKISRKLTPFVEKWLFSRQFVENQIITRVGPGYAEINMDCLFKQLVNEWSMPLVEGPDLLRALRTEIRKQEFYVHAPIEIRASNTTLPPHNIGLRNGPGPIYGNITRPLLDPSPKLTYKEPGQISNEQLTLNLNATMYKPFGFIPPTEAWFSTFEKLCAAHGGKPHWAKNWTLNPWLQPENIESFQSWKNIRDRYAPSRLFGSREWQEEKSLL